MGRARDGAALQDLAKDGFRNIDRLQQGSPQRRADLEPLPYIVIIIDELADLMMLAPDEVETLICRLAQMARATGIHLIIATQRPSVDVVTGLIKANFPSRIAFAVTSQIDSRVILDMPGAEQLLGRGDMLYLAADAAKPVRVQGTYVSDRRSRADRALLARRRRRARRAAGRRRERAAAAEAAGPGSGGAATSIRPAYRRCPIRAPARSATRKKMSCCPRRSSWSASTSAPRLRCCSAGCVSATAKPPS